MEDLLLEEESARTLGKGDSKALLHETEHIYEVVFDV